MSFDDIDGIILGELSLGLEELNFLTYREIFLAHERYLKKVEFEKQIAYNSARVNAWLIINSNRKRIHQIQRPEYLVRFEWDDKKNELKKMTRKQQLKYQKKYIRINLN